MEAVKKYPMYYYNAADNKVLARKSDTHALIYQVFNHPTESKCYDSVLNFSNKQEMDNLVKLFAPCTAGHYIALVADWHKRQAKKIEEMKQYFK